MILSVTLSISETSILWILMTLRFPSWCSILSVCLFWCRPCIVWLCFLCQSLAQHWCQSPMCRCTLPAQQLVHLSDVDEWSSSGSLGSCQRTSWRHSWTLWCFWRSVFFCFFVFLYSFFFPSYSFFSFLFLLFVLLLYFCFYFSSSSSCRLSLATHDCVHLVNLDVLTGIDGLDLPEVHPIIDTKLDG